jgi:putative adhesin
MKKMSLRNGVVTIAALALSALPAFGAARGQFERTLPVNGSVNLQVETGSGSVEVHRGGSNQVHVVGRIYVSEWFSGNADEKVKKLESNPPIQQSGNDIRIGHIDDPELKHNVSVSYEITVPANTQLHASSGSGNEIISDLTGPVEANTGSGDLKCSNIGAGVRAHTGSGDIEISGANGSVYARTGSGSIHAMNIGGGFDGETGSGHLTLEQSAPGSVRAETGSGGLELRNVKGSLQAQAGSGDIKVEGEATGGWTVHTGSGSVDLRLPQNASFDLDAHTGSGSIDLSHPVSVQGSIGKHEVRGKVGGGGVPVEVHTGSGSIRIE